MRTITWSRKLDNILKSAVLKLDNILYSAVLKLDNILYSAVLLPTNILSLHQATKWLKKTIKHFGLPEYIMLLTRV